MDKRCEFTSTNMMHLNKHMRNEHISTLYPCIQCDVQLKSIDQLREHTRNTHTVKDYQNQTGFQYNCDVCHFTSKELMTLNQHKSPHAEPASKAASKFCQVFLHMASRSMSKVA